MTALAPRRFYPLMGLVMCGLVILGFSRTFYLKAFFNTPPLTLLLQLHGSLLSLWLVLFAVQARLGSSGRYELHRRLGVAGAILAGLVVLDTYVTAVQAARIDGDHGGITAADRLYSTVLVLAIFGCLVVLGIVFRKRREIHKRLMLLATIAILGPAITRAAVLLAGHPIRDSHIAVLSALVLGALIHDWRMRGRPHWIWLYGGPLVIGLQWSRRLVGGSETWAQIGNWLIQ